MPEKPNKINKVNLFGVSLLILDIVLQFIFRRSQLGLENRGVSFGFGQGFGNVISFVVVLIFISCFVYETIVKKRFSLYLWLLALGGAGNVFARIVWGSVWDYICLPILPFCFNLSDVLISLGVVSYILGVNGNRDTLRGRRHDSDKQAGGSRGK